MQKVQQRELAQVSSYDRTEGILNASLILVGFLVVTLFLIWLTMTSEPRLVGFTQPPVVPPAIPDEPLILEDLAELKEFTPTAAADFQGDIQSLSDAVSTVKAGLFTKALNESEVASYIGRETGPVGFDDGDHGDGPKTIPAHKRWKMTYRCSDLNEYKQLLGHYSIQIGVVNLSSNQIHRLVMDDGGFKVVPSSRRDENESFYFHNSRTTARRWDQHIARSLGIEVEGTTTVHFYDDHQLAKLAKLEAGLAARDGKGIEEIARTQFIVQTKDSGFELMVDSIEYK